MSGVRIATLRGIPIRLHYSFLLVLPLLYRWAHRERGASRGPVSVGVQA